MKPFASWGLAAILLLSGCAGFTIRREQFRWVGTEAAYELALDSQVYLLDVSSYDDYAQAHILGSHNLPYRDLWPRFAELPEDKDAAMLIVCQDGEKTARAAALLRDEGYTRVHALRGGLKDWQAAGLPVVPSGPLPWRGEPGI